MDQESTVGRLCKLAEKAFNGNERRNQESLWDLIAEYMLPNQSGTFYSTTGAGEKKTRRLFDSTAGQANHDLAAAMHATLTNPSTQWSKIRYKSDVLNNNEEAIAWLQEANKKIHEALNESNFDTQISKNYQAFSSLGTMILFHEEEESDSTYFSGFRFNAWHLSEVSFSEGLNGKVDTVYRKFKMTARQISKKFPKTVPKEIEDEVFENPDKEYEIYHVLMPRSKNEIKLNDAGLAPPKARPFASYYLCKITETILEEGGYYEFPVYVTRWQTMPGEIYGRGPGHIALPDVRTLNKVKEFGLQAIAKSVNPPYLAEQRGILGSLDLRPGQVSVVRNINAIKEMVPQTRYDVTQFAVNDLKESIKMVFFIDKLMLPPRTQTGEMTAFEIQQRTEQMQRVFGPTLSRLNSEFLTPLIVRCFKMLLRRGGLPAPPDIVSQNGISVDIAFVNSLARSQQYEDITTMQQWVQQIGMLAQLKPEVLDYVDADKIAKITARIMNIPEAAITNDDMVAQLRHQRQQQQQANEQLTAGTQLADMGAKIQGGNPSGK